MKKSRGGHVDPPPGEIGLRKLKKLIGSSWISKIGKNVVDIPLMVKNLVGTVFVNPITFMVTHNHISQNRTEGRAHSYSINLIIKFAVKQEIVSAVAKIKRRFRSLALILDPGFTCWGP